jgi:iron(III) transport system substrate-binding protein
MFGAAASDAAAQPPPGYPRSYQRIIDAAKKGGKLTIYSATDVREMADLLRDFNLLYPQIVVRYEDLSSWEVYRRFVSDVEARRVTADLVINSAMDLQIKLVNDGYAQTYASPEKPYLPDWAVWKNQAFGLSSEPIVFAYNKKLVRAEDVPGDHDELQQLLERKRAAYSGRVAMLDPETSSTGFLYITQDVQLDRDTWSLIRAIGKTKPKLYISTDEIIRKIVEGEYFLGYNIIGSYALDQQRRDPNFGVVFPSDYTLAISRIALIPKDAPHPDAAKLFLDYLLSQRGQSFLARHQMTPLRLGSPPGQGARPDPNHVKSIRVGPALLVNLDQMKRANFIREWRRALGLASR